MKYKHRQIVYKTGSNKGIVIDDDDVKIQKYYYVKKENDEQVSYLQVCDGSFIFTDFSSATPFTQNKAVEYVNYFRKMKLNVSLFASSKKTI